jgi:hypothetical protein
MLKASIFLIMTIIIMMMMVIVITTISLQTHEVYAENKAKELCSEYDGEWDNGKCKIKDDEGKVDYEDDLCDDPKDTKKYKKICKSDSGD